MRVCVRACVRVCVCLSVSVFICVRAHVWVFSCSFTFYFIIDSRLAVEPPIITKHPEDQDGNETEEDITFTVTAEGVELNFKWKKSGTPLTECMGQQGKLNFKSANLPVLLYSV